MSTPTAKITSHHQGGGMTWNRNLLQNSSVEIPKNPWFPPPPQERTCQFLCKNHDCLLNFGRHSPQKFNVDTKKLPYFKPESPFPTPSFWVSVRVSPAQLRSSRYFFGSGHTPLRNSSRSSRAAAVKRWWQRFSDSCGAAKIRKGLRWTARKRQRSPRKSMGNLWVCEIYIPL